MHGAQLYKGRSRRRREFLSTVNSNLIQSHHGMSKHLGAFRRTLMSAGKICSASGMGFKKTYMANNVSNKQE